MTNKKPHHSLYQMINSYSEVCAANLFRHSQEKENYEEALKEWFFYNEVIDNFSSREEKSSKYSCELCEHENLRWQFVIKNQKNNEQMKVGSSCIKQFNIALIDEKGRRILGRERNLKINKIIAQARIDSANKLTFKALNDLSKIDKSLEQNCRFIESWTQLKVNGTIEPKLALFLINNFIENGIEYQNLDMKIDVKKKKSKEQLKNMNEKSFSLVSVFLSDPITQGTNRRKASDLK